MKNRASALCIYYLFKGLSLRTSFSRSPLSKKLQTIYMGLFTLCSNLKTKESYDRWVTRILREFRHQISKAKYPRRSQNVGCKYLEASGEHCSCATFCLQFGVIRVNAMEDPDMADRESWNAFFPIRILNSGCHPGVDAAPDVSGGSRIPDVIHQDGNELAVVVLWRPYLPHFSSNSYTVWSVGFLTS